MTNNEFQGNPESGIDRFLNESNGIELPSDQEALDKIKDLENNLQGALSSREYWEDLANNRAQTIVKARDLIQEILEGHTEAEEIMEAFKEPFDLLGVEVEREVEIEISVTWRGTISLPLGVEVSDLDIDDFGLNEPEHNEYSSYFSYHGIRDYSIDER